MKILLPIILCLSLSFTNLFADQTGDKRKKLLITFEEYPPYEFAIKGDYDGITVRKVKKVCQLLGFEPIFIPAPWSRALYMVMNGDVDAIISLHRTPERELKLIYPDIPLASNQDRLYSLRSKNIPKIESFDYLKGYSIGVVADNSYGAQFDRLTLPNKVVARDHRNLVERLSKGWIDIIVINNNVFDVHRTELKFAENLFMMHPLVVNSESLYIAFSRKVFDHKSLAELFTYHLKSMANDPIPSLPLDKICKIGTEGCGKASP